MSDKNFEASRKSSTTESRNSRLERYEAELRDLYRKVDKKLDQIKSLKERMATFDTAWAEKKWDGYQAKHGQQI